jgi:phage gpG-like protein
MGLKLKVESKGFLSVAAIRNMVRSRMEAMNNWRTPLKHISMIMYRGVILNFRTQGQRVVAGGWKPLSPVTIAGRRKGKGAGSPRILQDTGALLGANMPYADEREASVTNNMPYAAAMHFGRKAMIGKVGAYKRADGVEVRAHRKRLPAIPARPFMLLNDDDMTQIKRTALLVLQGRL